jgi:hypothetical protein
MSRNHPPDSSRRAPLASAKKIDTPALVVLALTAFFATLFSTLVLLRPEASDPTEPLPTDSRATQSAPRLNPPPVSAPPPSAQQVNAPPISAPPPSAQQVNAPPVSAPPPSAQQVNAPPVSAPPSESIGRAEPKPEPEPALTLRARLEQLGINCAEGANCYPTRHDPQD